MQKLRSTTNHSISIQKEVSQKNSAKLQYCVSQSIKLDILCNTLIKHHLSSYMHIFFYLCNPSVQKYVQKTSLNVPYTCNVLYTSYFLHGKRHVNDILPRVYYTCMSAISTYNSPRLFYGLLKHCTCIDKDGA